MKIVLHHVVQQCGCGACGICVYRMQTYVRSSASACHRFAALFPLILRPATPSKPATEPDCLPAAQSLPLHPNPGKTLRVAPGASSLEILLKLNAEVYGEVLLVIPATAVGAAPRDVLGGLACEK